jgi:hypothetical protein
VQEDLHGTLDPLPRQFTPSLTQVGLEQGELMEQCRHDLHGTLEPLPRHFTSLPNPGWFGEGGPYEAVQVGPAEYSRPMAQAVHHLP